jgi:hypothetical protein
MGLDFRPSLRVLVVREAALIPVKQLGKADGKKWLPKFRSVGIKSRSAQERMFQAREAETWGPRFFLRTSFQPGNSTATPGESRKLPHGWLWLKLGRKPPRASRSCPRIRLISLQP